jgi:CDP-6-deoxy-D-xylo-4-hexulose-3-dehydrase
MHGVGTRLLFAGNVLRQPMFVNSDIDLRIEDSVICKSNSLTEDDYAMLPNSEFVMNNTFWVGVAQNLKLDDMNTIAKTIRNYFK